MADVDRVRYFLWPSLQTAFTTEGALSWYRGWNIIAFFLLLLLMPKIKGKTLEELDQVFSVPTRIHASYGMRQVPYFFRRYLPRQHAEPERLYEKETAEDRDLGFGHPDPGQGFEWAYMGYMGGIGHCKRLEVF